MIYFFLIFISIMLPITENDFICKGDSTNQQYIWNNVNYSDCCGNHLPESGINSDLIEVLNILQEKFNSKVIIISGYRCQQHNNYIAAELFNYINPYNDSGNPYEVSMRSKHMMGAAADFYVEGYEFKPEEVIDTILSIIGRDNLRIYPLSQKTRSGFYDNSYYTYNAYSTSSWWFHPYSPSEGRDIDCRVYNGIYIHLNKKLNFTLIGYDPKNISLQLPVNSSQ